MDYWHRLMDTSSDGTLDPAKWFVLGHDGVVHTLRYSMLRPNGGACDVLTTCGYHEGAGHTAQLTRQTPSCVRCMGA